MKKKIKKIKRKVKRVVKYILFSMKMFRIDKYHVLKGNNTYNLSLKKICDIMDIEVPECYMDKKNEKVVYTTLLTSDIKKDYVYFMLDDELPFNETLEKVYSSGAKFMFVDEEYYNSCDNPNEDLPFIIVESLYEKVGRFYAYIRNLSKSKVVAITGTVGKTTTTRLLECVAKDNFNAYCSPGNTNSYRATAEHILKYINKGYDVYIQECGAASLKSIRKAASMLEPNIFILLNVTDHHMNKYKTYETLFEDKSSFQDYVKPNGFGVVNMDDEGIANTKFKCNTITFGINTDKKVDYRAINIVQNNEYLEFDVVHSEGKTHVKLNILGEHNAYNALAVFAVSKYLGVEDDKIVESLSGYQTSGIRQNIKNVGGMNLFIDCYNVCAASIHATMKAMEQFKTTGKKIAFLGGENKLGASAYDVTYKCGLGLKGINVDEIVCVGPSEETPENIDRYGHGRALYEGIRDSGFKNVSYITDLDLFKEKLKEIKPNDLALVKIILWLDIAPLIDSVFGTSYGIEYEYYSSRAKVLEDKDYKASLIYNMNEVNLFKYDGDTRKLVIPDKIGKYKTIRIGRKLFKNNKTIEKVNFGTSIRNIGFSSFANCIKIKQLNIPSNLRIIEAFAFSHCYGLKEVKIEEGLIDIGESVFYNCKNLKKIYIPKSVKHIGSDAFKGCVGLCIYCYKNSYAHNYAKENSIDFKIL